MLCRYHTILLLTLASACTDSKGETVGDASTSESDSDSDSGPTGDFPMCSEPDAKENVGYTLEFGNFPMSFDFEVTCTVKGGLTFYHPTVEIDLDCFDVDAVFHPVRISLELFYEPVLTLFDAPEVRLQYHRRAVEFGEDIAEVVALRGPDDALLLYLASGFDVLAEPQAAQFAAPLDIAQVDEALCATLGDCDTSRRAAIDVTLDATTQRVFDRGWVEFTGTKFSVNLGTARVVELNTTGGCASDAPDGFQATLVIFSDDA